MIKLEISVTLTDKITMKRAQEMRTQLLEAFNNGKKAGDVSDVNVIVSDQSAPYEAVKVILPTRLAAEQVADRIAHLIKIYMYATVADLYDLCGVSTTHNDAKWGWDNFTVGGIKRVPTGYELGFSPPKSLSDIITGG